MKKKKSPLGQLVKEYRLKAGLTQIELANKLGYSIPQFVSLMENGHSKIPLNVLGELISFLGIPEKKVFEILVNSYIKEAKQQITIGKNKAAEA